MNRQTRLALTAFCVIVILLLMLAAYGYWTGAWDDALSPP
jgi:hypothetical protein